MGIPHWLRHLLARLRAFLATLFGSNDDDDGSSSPPPAPPAPYDLGELPDELPIRWPTPPSISREVQIVTSAQIEDRWREPNTRLRVRTALDWLVIDADDVEVVVDEGVHIGRVFIVRGRKRIRFEGGTYEQVELQVPVQFVPAPPVWRSDWLVEDVLFERVHVTSATDSAFLLRGRRIGILHSTVESRRYAVWCGDTAHMQSEDIVLAGNRFECDGDEATVRLADVLRSVVVDNRMENPVKHNYRVHGRSDLNFAARNTLVDAGVMLASMDDDALGTAWFTDNVLHNRTESLLVVDEDRILRLELTDNVVFSDRWSCLWCTATPETWVVEGNVISPYHDAPVATDLERAPGRPA